jgi:hypothetical protein
MRQAISVEQQIIDLFGELQRLVCRPTWSFQLEEIRILLAELVACWDLYRSCGDGDAHPLVGPRFVDAAGQHSPERPGRPGPPA